MTTIDQIDEQDLEVEWDLTILEDSVNQAIETLDYEQALVLIRKGIEISEKIQSKKWINLFRSILSEVKIIISDTDKKQAIADVADIITPKGEQEMVVKEVNSKEDTSKPFVASVKKGTTDISQINGIGVTTANLFRQAGIHTLQDLASKNIGQLCSIKGIAAKSAEKYIRAAKYQMQQESLKNFVPVKSKFEEKDAKSIDIKLTLNADNASIKSLEQIETLGDIDDSLKNRLDIEEIYDLIETESVEENLPDFNIEDFEEDKNQQVTNCTLQKKILKNSMFQENQSENRAELEDELLDWKESSSLIRKIENFLHSGGFSLLPSRKTMYIELFQQVDAIGIKSVQVSDLMEIVLIVPIKLAKTTGDLKIGEEEIKYHPKAGIDSLNPYKERLLVESGIKALKITTQKLLSNIDKAGSVLSYLSKYFQEDLSVQKPFSGNTRILKTKELVIKTIITPILVSKGDVRFLEALKVPFAYQKKKNMHVVSESQLSDLLDYLEKKHFITNSLVKNETFLEEYINSCDKTLKKATIFSIPFSLFGIGLLLFTVVNRSMTFPILMVSFGMMILMISGLSFISYSFFQSQRNLKKQQDDGEYGRALEIDDSDLILIADRLEGPFLDQFVYEHGLNPVKFKLLSDLEIKNTLKASEVKAEQLEFTSYKNQLLNDLNENLVRKYSKFLED
ncbi:MAG: hypothetical protein JW891_08055 [Candidatus Lokiarchaeota archaeon]|nr:hypothetical protein [Candidatus Lokiarchaeota archaeon]